MSGHARTGGFAEVHAKVDAVRGIDFADSCLSRLDQIHHLVRRSFFSFVD